MRKDHASALADVKAARSQLFTAYKQLHRHTKFPVIRTFYQEQTIQYDRLSSCHGVWARRFLPSGAFITIGGEPTHRTSGLSF